jgi:uncharacterized membrane protein
MKSSIKKRNILEPREFALRMLRFFIYSIALLTMALLIGVFGYHYIAELTWIDSLYNASMILAGMGPVNLLVTDAAKFFASFYALLSGVVFLSTFALFFSPIAHRLLHILHVDEDENDSE